MKKNHEAFDWVDPKNFNPELDKKFLVKVVAKTPSKTDHRKDMTIPKEDRVVRIYPKEELKAAARSLSMRHIDFNHDVKRVIPEALVLDAEWFDERVEALLYIPNLEIIGKLKAGKYSGFSVEENVREEEETEEGMIQKGLTYFGLAIVEPPFTPGDKNATGMEFFETNGLKFEALLESKILDEVGTPDIPYDTVTITAIPDQIVAVEKDKIISGNVKGEPFADYADFADCVAKNQDKDNPEAYCGQIKAQTEGKTLEEAKLIVSKIPFALKKVESIDPDPKKVVEPKKDEEIKSVDPNHKVTADSKSVDSKVADLKAKVVEDKLPEKKPEERIKELEEAVGRLAKIVEGNGKTQAEKINVAKTEAKKEVIDKITKVIPSNMVQRQATFGMQRLIQDVRKALRECE